MGGDDSQKLLPWRGDQLPLQGANLRLNYEINTVTETAPRFARLPTGLWLSLQAAWVIFGKHRWVSSGARRRKRFGCERDVFTITGIPPRTLQKHRHSVRLTILRAEWADPLRSR